MSSSSLPRAGSSTAQANLTKIITIIVTVPPLPSSPNADTNDISSTPPEAPVNLDLRLGLTLDLSPESEAFATAAEEEEGIPTAQSGVINCPNQAESVNKAFKNDPSAVDSIFEADASSEGECSPIKRREREISEITNTSCKEEEEINGEGYLDLLLEAARRVSGDCGNDMEDEDDEKTSSLPALRSKRRKTTSPPAAPPQLPAVVFKVYEETEPIVRSRRGRNQTLPLRYRDSVMEPWRKPPTVFRR